MTGSVPSVQQRHLALVEAIEDRFDVARWRSGDIDLWPAARMDLFLDLFRTDGGDTARPAPSATRRLAASLATPLTNAWARRRDLAHWAPWPTPADAILLGDGVSLDHADGAWRDRHGEPVMAALEQRGRSTFLMQPGGADRLPWSRKTFAANGIAVHGAATARLGRAPSIMAPDHARVLDYLACDGAPAPSLALPQLIRRAAAIDATASRFQRVLRAVRPSLAFVVTYYAGLGHAFLLACRREGVLSIDLQHCPEDGGHRAYRWRSLPPHGYTTLPAVFWTWTGEAAARFPANSWHAAVHGGHSQLAPYLDDNDAATRAWDTRVAGAAGDPAAEREILVALQPIGGRRAVWAALARQIEAAPASWRWWIRRHPAASAYQDAEHEALLGLRRSNVVVEVASAMPLPALLRRMSVLVSLASGAAAEAAMFGIPALFLDAEARGTFPGLLARGQAELVDVAEVTSRIARLPARPSRPPAASAPPIEETLQRLEEMACAYRRRCVAEPLSPRRRA